MILTLKNKECRYILLLLLKEFRCLDKEKIKKELSIKTNKSIDNNLKRAEEKLLINKEFREKYFYLEKKIGKKLVTWKNTRLLLTNVIL